MPLPGYQTPTYRDPEEFAAGQALEAAGQQSAHTYVTQAIGGQNPTRYDEGWADVADQFRQQFPGINPERAQQVYQTARHRAAIQGLSSTPLGGQESEARTSAGRIPVFGMGQRAEQNRADRAALERIRDGGATLADYAQLREAQGHQEFLANRSNLAAASDTVRESLAFGADMAIAGIMTGGFGAPEVAAGRGFLAGAQSFAIRGALTAPLTPGRAAASVTDRLIPDVSRDENGNLHIGGDKTWGDAFRGYVDHQIEIYSEMAGEKLLAGAGALLGGAGRGVNRAISRFPPAARAQAVAAGLAARIAPNAGLRSALSQAGFSNMLGEFLEERAGEIARGVTGVGDFGMIGNVVTPGHRMEALNQLIVEGLAFGGMQVGVSGFSMAANRFTSAPGTQAITEMKRLGFSPEAARDQVMAAVTAIANGEATPQHFAPGPLRTMAEALQQRIKDAEDTPTAERRALDDATSGPRQGARAPVREFLERQASTATSMASLDRQLSAGNAVVTADFGRSSPAGQRAVEDLALKHGYNVTPKGNAGVFELTRPASEPSVPQARAKLDAAVQGLRGVAGRLSEQAGLTPAAQAAAQSTTPVPTTTNQTASQANIPAEQAPQGQVEAPAAPPVAPPVAAGQVTPAPTTTVPAPSVAVPAAAGVWGRMSQPTLEKQAKNGVKGAKVELARRAAARAAPAAPSVIKTPAPPVSQPLPKRSAGNLKGFEHPALKMVASSLQTSQAGSTRQLRQRIEKAVGGKAALAEMMPQIRNMLHAIAEQDVIQGKVEVPASLATAIEKSAAHPSGKAALLGALSGLSYDNVAALRTPEGKPVVADKRDGSSVSHETARSYARLAFDELKKENPGKWDHYPKLEYYRGEMQAGKIRELSRMIKGQAAISTAEIQVKEEAAATALKEMEDERAFYEDDVKRKDKHHGISERRTAEDVARAREEEPAHPEPARSVVRTPGGQSEQTRSLAERVRARGAAGIAGATAKAPPRLTPTPKPDVAPPGMLFQTVPTERGSLNPYYQALKGAGVDVPKPEWKRTPQGHGGDSWWKALDYSIYHDVKGNGASVAYLGNDEGFISQHATVGEAKRAAEMHMLNTIADSLHVDLADLVPDADRVEGMQFQTGQGGTAARQTTRGPHWTPVHARVSAMFAKTLQAADHLSKAQQFKFGSDLDTVLSNMNEKMVGAVEKNVRAVEWHPSVGEVTQSLARVSDEAAEILAQGEFIGGCYSAFSGTLILDGGAEGVFSAQEIYAHELFHAIDGPTFKYSGTRKFRNEIFPKELDKGQLSDYAATNPVEAFAEFGRELVGNGASASALAERFPKMVEFLETNGIMPDNTGAEVPLEEIFEKPFYDRGLRGDTLKKEQFIKLATSPALEEARVHVSPSGQAKSPHATARAAASANAVALGKAFRIRADDSLTMATEIDQAVAANRARMGLTPTAPGMDLRTVIASSNPQVSSWTDEMAAKGMFTFEQDPNTGERVQTRIGRSVDHITEGLNYKPEDLASEGKGVVADLKRKFNLPVTERMSRLSTAMVSIHSVGLVARGQAMLQKHLTFITPAEEAMAARLINMVSTEQLEAFKKYLDHEHATDPQFLVKAEESLRRLTKMYDLSLEALKSVGFYSQQDVDNIKKNYPDYISMARVIEADAVRKGAGGTGEIKPGWEKKRMGSQETLAIMDPILSLRNRYAETAWIMAKQLQNEALMRAGVDLGGEYFTKVDMAPGVRLTDLAEKMTALGIPAAQQKMLIDVIGPETIEYMGMPKWDANGKNYYVFRQNGQRTTLEITNKHLYELLTNNQSPTVIVGSVTQALLAIPGLAQIPKLVKWGATNANLVFPVRNMTKDVWAAIRNDAGAPILQRLGSLVMGHKMAFKAAGQTLFDKDISDVYAKLYHQTTGQQLREFGYTSTSAGEKAFRKIEGSTPAYEKTVQVFHKAQEVLEVIGAGEHGPRVGAFREVLIELGFTEAKIEASLAAEPHKSPIPLHILFHARQVAAERTTDYLRQGVDVREANKVMPFFSPQVANLSLEARQWGNAYEEWKSGKFGPWSKSMVGALGVFLAYELLHWWSFKDKDWYKNQLAHQRYGWWNLGQDSKGAMWGVPKPQGFMQAVGAQFQELLRATSDSDSRPGMAAGYGASQLNPLGLPVIASQAWQVGTNRDWRGAPIVPNRDLKEMNEWNQFTQHQLPYILDQLSGGLASGRVFRAPWEAFQSSRNEPNLPVNDYYTRLEAATGAHQRAGRLNQQLPPDQAREYARLHAVEQVMRRLAKRARGEMGGMPSADELLEIRRRQNMIARRVLS